MLTVFEGDMEALTRSDGESVAEMDLGAVRVGERVGVSVIRDKVRRRLTEDELKDIWVMLNVASSVSDIVARLVPVRGDHVGVTRADCVMIMDADMGLLCELSMLSLTDCCRVLCETVLEMDTAAVKEVDRDVVRCCVVVFEEWSVADKDADVVSEFVAVTVIGWYVGDSLPDDVAEKVSVAETVVVFLDFETRNDRDTLMETDVVFGVLGSRDSDSV